MTAYSFPAFRFIFVTVDNFPVNIKEDIRDVTGSPYKAATWWLWLWGFFCIALLGTAWVLPFKYWVIQLFTTGFVMEMVGVFHNQMGTYPPLTDVMRTYVPRWGAFLAIWGLIGAAGAVWGVSWSKPLTMGLWCAVLGWLQNHFTQRYDQPAYD